MRYGSSRAGEVPGVAHRDRGTSAAEIADIERLGRLLDARFAIPGTSIRFGIDSLVGLIPGVGDTATALVSLYIIARARALGVSGWILARMAGNVALDMLIGAIPLVGDIFDIGFKANLRNVRLLKRAVGAE